MVNPCRSVKPGDGNTHEGPRDCLALKGARFPNADSSTSRSCSTIMSSPQNDEQRHVAVPNFPVPAGSQPGDASPSHCGDQLRDYPVPCSLTQADHPHDALVLARPQSPSPRLQPGPQGIIATQHSKVQARKTSGDATRSTSTTMPPSHVGTPRPLTTPDTLGVGFSNTSEDASTLEDPYSGSSDIPTTRPDDGLSGISNSQRARSTENLATSSQSPTTCERIPGRGLNPGVSAGVDHSNGVRVEPLHQLSPATAIKRERLSQSAQQQAHKRTSSAHPTRATNTSYTSPASSFNISTSDVLQDSLASQYTIEGGAFVNPYVQYFYTS